MLGFGVPGHRRRDAQKSGASQKKASLARRLGRRLRLPRRRERGGRQAPAGGFQGQLLQLHNNARPANYRLNGDLCESAQGRAEEMDRTNKMFHERQWWKRIERAGYDARRSGENLGEGFSTAEAVFAAWMKSPAHKDNVMGPCEDIGFGHSGGYWCTHFGSR